MSLAARAFLLVLCLITELHATAVRAGAIGDFAGLVDIGGGRKLYVECRGIGSPAVILVAGLRGSAEEWISADIPASMRSWRNGRRASLRCLWGKPRGSSSLLDRTNYLFFENLAFRKLMAGHVATSPPLRHELLEP